MKVVKIGGSVFKKENIINLAEFIVKNYEPYKTIIVVSALGRSPYPYSTDELINLFVEFKQNHSNGNNYLLDLSKSFVVSCGENIAAGLLSFAINYLNPEFKAIPLNAFQANIITTDNPIDSDIITIEIDNILRLLENKFTPVICGFQGVSKSGKLTILKRGGTDITAAFITKLMKANEIHIIKDVDGLKSAPPNIVPHCITIEKCNIDELAEATMNGNPVVNPEAINILQETNTKIIIKSIFSEKFSLSSKEIVPTQLVSNISNKDNITKFVIYLPSQMKNKTLVLDKVLKEIFENSISLDFINLDVFNNLASFIVNNNQVEKIKQILDNNQLHYKTMGRLSKVSIIGYNMRGKPGIMYRINKALLNEKISIIQAQDSHISISLLVPLKYLATTIKALHQEFFEDY